MDGTGGHYINWNRQGTENSSGSPSHEESKNVDLIEGESRIVVSSEFESRVEKMIGKCHSMDVKLEKF